MKADDLTPNPLRFADTLKRRSEPILAAGEMTMRGRRLRVLADTAAEIEGATGTAAA